MNEIDELSVRVQRLESRCRRLRVWCLVSSALLATGCLMAALRPAEDELRARAFVLVDEQGRTRGALACDEEHALLTLQSGDGSEGVIVGVGALATRSESRSPEEEAAARRLTGLVAWSEGDAETGLWLSHGESGMAYMGVGEAAALLTMEARDEPWGVCNLYASGSGAGLSGSLNDEVSFGLGATEERGGLTLSTDWQANGQEDDRVELSTTREGSVLRLFDAEGELTFEVP